jgi:hypothetical protein
MRVGNSVVRNWGTSQSLRRIAQFIWFEVCVYVLVSAQQAYAGKSDWKMEESLALQMMLLVFPASFVVMAGIIALGFLLGLFGWSLPPSSPVEMTVTWAIFVAVGYLQWFLILPKVWSHLETTRFRPRN